MLGLELGADDYVVKPFSPRELAARVRTVLRRVDAPAADGRAPLEFGRLRIDPTTRDVTVDGDSVDLTPKEFDLLLHACPLASAGVLPPPAARAGVGLGARVSRTRPPSPSTSDGSARSSRTTPTTRAGSPPCGASGTGSSHDRRVVGSLVARSAHRRAARRRRSHVVGARQSAPSSPAFVLRRLMRHAAIASPPSARRHARGARDRCHRRSAARPADDPRLGRAAHAWPGCSASLPSSRPCWWSSPRPRSGGTSAASKRPCDGSRAATARCAPTSSAPTSSATSRGPSTSSTARLDTLERERAGYEAERTRHVVERRPRLAHTAGRAPRGRRGARRRCRPRPRPLPAVDASRRRGPVGARR